MPITSIVPVIDESGISAPVFADIQEWLKDKYRVIYGNDVYLDNDSQDGQFLGILARCIADSNAVAISVYNSFSPATAVGEGLSRNVKLNGISRAIPTNSTVTVKLVGVNGTQISNGKVGDSNGNQWLLPALITIGQSGEAVATATAVKLGSIISLPNSITRILTPTRGWQSVTNDAAATSGAPLELDGALRQRQALSVAIPSKSLLDGLYGAVYSLSGVTRTKVYENETSEVDVNGLPPKSIAVVVSGGSVNDIATVISVKKPPGCGLYGNTTAAATDSKGYPVVVKFWRPVQVNFTVQVSLRARANYSTETEGSIKQSVADYLNQLDIGDLIVTNDLMVPAKLDGASVSKSYQVVDIAMTANGQPVDSEYVLAFNQVAACLVANVSISVV